MSRCALFMDLKTPVSGRQFAKMVGQSEGAVRKAVDRGSIVNGLTADKKYIPIIASSEWGKAILPEFHDGKSAAVPKAATSPPPPKPKRVAKPERATAQTADQVVQEVLDEKLPSISKDDLENIDDEDPEETSDTVLKPEAERQAAILKVKILRLAYMEKRGQMVPITKVNAVNFAFGQEIRTAIEGLRYRCLDKIMGAKNRQEADRFFEKEINETLNLLADIQSRKIE